MKNEEMIERYIYAVTKNLQSKIKKDVADELKSLIYDMLEERTGDIVPTEHDVRVVLTELGTPSELSQKYSPDSEKCLIGAPYYSKYKFVLKVVLLSVAFGLTLSQILGSAFLDTTWYEAIGQWFLTVFGGATFAFTFITILFAVFYHKNINIDSGFGSLDDLPPVPKNNEKVSKWECVFDIALTVVFVFVFLLTPQFFCGIFENGTIIPVFNIDVLKSTWLVIVAFAALEITRDSFKLIEGRYTTKLAVVTVISNLLLATLSSFWLLNNNLINSEFTEKMVSLINVNNDADFITKIFGNFQYILLGVIIFALLLDMLTVTIKAVKAHVAFD